MQSYREFFLSTKNNIVSLETLELYHPSFSKSYFIVRNAAKGLTAVLENGIMQFFEYYPATITPITNKEDLDFGLQIKLGDTLQIVQNELELIKEQNANHIKPIVIYRMYRSDKLDMILYGPISLEISKFSFTEKGVAFEATAPKANINGTGELYRINRFPMLRGYVY